MKCRRHGVDCDLASSDDNGPDQASTQGTPALQSLPSGKDKDCPRLDESQASTPSLSESLPLTPSILHALDNSGAMESPLFFVRAPATQDMANPKAILYHFRTTTAMTCGGPASQAVNRSSVIAAAAQSPYLMHALLGFATAHLRHLMSPDLAASRAYLKVTECHHWASAFDGFRKELAGSEQTSGVVTTKHSNVNRRNMDHLLSTLMLVSMHQFSYRDYQSIEMDPADRSFVWMEDRAERDAALKWLGIEAGFKGLIGAMSPWLNESFWLPIMRRVDVDSEANLDSWLMGHSKPKQPIDDMERRLIALCEISTIPKDHNPYYTNVETLIWCRSFRPIGPEHFNQMIAFVGRTTADFRQKVIGRDTRALIILVHWLNIMYDVGQWWIVERCKAEIQAIATFICGRDTNAPDYTEIVSLLRQPAAKVGLTLL